MSLQLTGLVVVADTERKEVSFPDAGKVQGEILSELQIKLLSAAILL